MKLTVRGDAFADAMQTCRGVIETKTGAVESLKSVLLTSMIGSAAVKIRAVSAEQRVEITVPAQVAEPGVLAVDGVKLSAVAREAAKSEEVSLSRSGEHHLRVKVPGAHWTVPGIDHATFPASEVAVLGDNPVAIDIDASMLARALRQTVFAAAVDGTEGIISGVGFRPHPTKASTLLLFGTNRHRIVRLELPIAYSEGLAIEDDGFVVPTDALKKLQGMLKGHDDLVTIRVGDREMEAEIGTARWGARLLEGKFPVLDPLFGTARGFPSIVEVSAADLAAAFRKAGLLSDGRIPVVVGRIERAGRIVLRSVEVPDGDSEVEVMCQAGLFGEESVGLAVNARYVLDYLVATEASGMIQIRVKDGSSGYFLTGPAVPEYLLSQIRIPGAAPVVPVEPVEPEPKDEMEEISL